MNIKDMPIAGKFMLIAAAFLLFGAGATFFATSRMSMISQRYSGLLSGQDRGALQAARVSRGAQTVRAAIADLVMARTVDQYDSAKAELNTTHKLVDDLLASAYEADPADRATFDEIKAHILDERAACAASASISLAANDGEAQKNQQAFLSDCTPKFQDLASFIQGKTAAMAADSSRSGQGLQALTGSTAAVTWIVTLVGLIAVVGGGVLMVRQTITEPLRHLGDVMARLARGELKTEVPDPLRKDELGAMSRAVQVFKEAGLEKQRLEAETAAAREAVEQERARNEAARAQAAEAQSQVVKSLASGLSRLAAGDLAQSLDQPFAADYEGLRADYNSAVATLRGTVGEVVVKAGAIRSGADEISHASDDLSQRTERQAANLEETAAALDQITSTVKMTAEGAEQARTLVGEARQDAERSGEVVGRAVRAMDGIEQSARQISQIIGVIDEIAFQTNLLALNAGVEAARAGDAGRGFAVVASEVRALAQRSADAAKEIKALILSSDGHVKSGVELVSEAGKALDRIVAQVTQINGVVSEIAASAQEQATGLHQVNAAVNQMDQVVQQNAAMVEQSTAAAASLKNETAQLAELMARFKTGAAAQAPVRQARAAAAAPAPRAMIATRRTGANPAARLSIVAEADGWEEF
jgi:methyl-accepting chemotaxis protein